MKPKIFPRSHPRRVLDEARLPRRAAYMRPYRDTWPVRCPANALLHHRPATGGSLYSRNHEAGQTSSLLSQCPLLPGKYLGAPRHAAGAGENSCRGRETKILGGPVIHVRPQVSEGGKRASASRPPGFDIVATGDVEAVSPGTCRKAKQSTGACDGRPRHPAWRQRRQDSAATFPTSRNTMMEMETYRGCFGQLFLLHGALLRPSRFPQLRTSSPRPPRCMTSAYPFQARAPA